MSSSRKSLRPLSSAWPLLFFLTQSFLLHAERVVEGCLTA
jgi:hypothetical protein